jgi:two-component system, NtrC family, response regulator AtoC
VKALIIDGDPAARADLDAFLSSRGYRTAAAASEEEGVFLAERLGPEIVFVDEGVTKGDFDSLFGSLRAGETGARIILTAARVEIDRAVRAMKSGAEYYFLKPLDFEQVAVILDRLEERIPSPQSGNLDTAGAEAAIIGNSSAMIRIRRMVSLLARNVSTPVLILGESGAGKQMVAKAIHDLSRLPGPLVEINCASLTENLLETELFGHEKGAFTDAKNAKPGLFEVAASGSIFFDEISEMPLNLQARLLKVLDSRRFRRVGGVTEISTEARFIAATNRDVGGLVEKGLFREDLYYRINVLPVTVPPLRQRREDIPGLADYFAVLLAKTMGKGRIRLSGQAVELLRSYRWPGNVRQLRNVIERALIVGEGHEILPGDLPPEVVREGATSPRQEGALRTLQAVEEEHIRHVLESNGGNHSRSASILGISRSTLLAKLRKMDRL